MNVATYRLNACQGCRERRGNRCRLTNQIVSVMARTPGVNCPVGRWSKPTATRILETERIARDVTIGISAFRRPGCVERLVESIRRFYPKTKIIIGDNGDQPAKIQDDHLTYLRLPFNIGLSATRNRIVDALETPYLWLLDDDFEFTAETDCGRFLDRGGEWIPPTVPHNLADGMRKCQWSRRGRCVRFPRCGLPSVSTTYQRGSSHRACGRSH
jgi:hypothetical protein